MAPVLYVENINNAFTHFADVLNLIGFVSERSDSLMYGTPLFTDWLGPMIVEQYPRTVYAIVKAIVGHNKKGDKISLNRLAMMSKYDMGGCSTKNLQFFDQLRKSGQLRQFDYGPNMNTRIYGQEQPPLVPVHNLKSALTNVPILLISGT